VPLKLEDVPLLDPDPGSIRVKVRACGVCHTDLHIVEGELVHPALPLTPEHEVVGVVDVLGKNVSRFAVGDRVGVPWLHFACGDCIYCQAGQENLCPSARFTGYTAQGGYADYVIVPADYAVPIPGRFEDEEAAPLLCAGIVGYRSLRLSEVQRGEKLGLYGFGASAHICIQIARHWDCEVYVFYPFRRTSETR
jgi:propanol-preferring alcohol dehydrogenase